MTSSILLLQQPERSSSIFNTVVICILVVAITVLVYFLFKKHQQLTNLSKSRRSLKEKLLQTESDRDRHKTERDRLNKEVQELKIKVKEPFDTSSNNHVNKEINSSDELRSDDMADKDEQPVVVTLESWGNDETTADTGVEQENIIYLPFPDRESTFYAPDASKAPTPDSFYKITDNKLFLYDNIGPEVMQMAINFEENHIRRVCEILNRREAFHLQLKMVVPGEVEKRQEDFIVHTKMKVKYV